MIIKAKKLNEKEYEPFGEDWQKEIMAIPIDKIQVIFNFPHTGELKKDYVAALSKEMIERTNQLKQKVMERKTIFQVYVNGVWVANCGTKEEAETIANGHAEEGKVDIEEVPV